MDPPDSPGMLTKQPESWGGQHQPATTVPGDGLLSASTRAGRETTYIYVNGKAPAAARGPLVAPLEERGPIAQLGLPMFAFRWTSRGLGAGLGRGLVPDRQDDLSSPAHASWVGEHILAVPPLPW